jgi:hypothetical protein
MKCFSIKQIDALTCLPQVTYMYRKQESTKKIEETTTYLPQGIAPP